MAGTGDLDMAGKCSLIIGGARSGKSSFAQDMAMGLSDKVLFVATAEPLNEEMEVRISKHREERPQGWNTVEAPVGLASQIESNMANNEVVIVDCLTLLTSNVILGQKRGFSGLDEIDEQTAEKQITAEIDAFIEIMKNSEATFLVVSNEVGLGLVPDNDLGRIYRDLLGRVNQMVARYADVVYLLMAGIAIKIKG